jgi:hypothetical protein
LNLSKSLYTIAIQCPKALWLKKYKPEVLTPTDEFSQAKFDTGHTVGELACSLFPNGIKIDFLYWMEPGDYALLGILIFGIITAIIIFRFIFCLEVFRLMAG